MHSASNQADVGGWVGSYPVDRLGRGMVKSHLGWRGQETNQFQALHLARKYV